MSAVGGSSAAREHSTRRDGGGSPAVLSAANEIAVEGFLAGRIGFLDISRVVEKTIEAMPDTVVESLDDVYGLDAEARRAAEQLVNGHRVG